MHEPPYQPLCAWRWNPSPRRFADHGEYCALKRNGFTLIELIVAVAIFVILGALAYGGYNTSARQAGIAKQSMERLRAVQTAIRLLTQDFEQYAPRPVRDVLGDRQLPSIQADPRMQVTVSLTRSGWTNPAGLPRSTLQRVNYVLENGKLRREHWTVLDATLSNVVVKRELLDKVKTFTIRYLMQADQWQTQWPPPNFSPQDAPRAHPLAVEIKLELEDYGEITRLIEVAG